MSQNILLGYSGSLVGVPQAPGRPPARMTEHAFRRGFALTAAASSCTSADEIPYWETVNKYLQRLDPKELHDNIVVVILDTVCQPLYAPAETKRVCHSIYYGNGTKDHWKNFLRRNTDYGNDFNSDWYFFRRILFPAYNGNAPYCL